MIYYAVILLAMTFLVITKYLHQTQENVHHFQISQFQKTRPGLQCQTGLKKFGNRGIPDLRQLAFGSQLVDRNQSNDYLLRRSISDQQIKSYTSRLKLVQQFKIQITRLKIGSTDQKLDHQIKSQISNSKVRSTNQKLDQQINVRQTDQKLDQQIKTWINRSKFRSQDKKLDQQIKSLMYLRCKLDSAQKKIRCNKIKLLQCQNPLICFVSWLPKISTEISKFNSCIRQFKRLSKI